MSRKPMITRTITSTEVVVLGMDLVNRIPVEQTVVLPRTYKNEKALMKVLAKTYDTDTFKVTAILDTVVKTELRGMTEQKFIENSEILDEDRKVINQEQEQ